MNEFIHPSVPRENIVIVPKKWTIYLVSDVPPLAVLHAVRLNLYGDPLQEASLVFYEDLSQ